MQTFFLEDEKMRRLLILLLVLGAASMASAITDSWVSGGTDDWGTGTNWSLGHVPYNGALNATGYADPLNEEAKITCASGAGPVIEVGDVVSAYRVFVAATGNGELTINGGTLLTNGYMTSSYTAGYNAVVNMLSGNVQIGFTGGTNGHWYLGRYGATIFNMSGGNFTIMNDLNLGQYASGSGTINLSGGTLTATTLKKTGTAKINITGSGKLVFIGDKTAIVKTWSDSGWLKSGTADFLTVGTATFDGVKTTLVVPEPATLCLLGIGALSLIRRKR